jgi:predicted RNase H-like HicB family nuclease
MKKLDFSATLVASEATIKTQLPMYIFKEDNTYVVYCPCLDLSAAGATEREAKAEFAEILRLHIEYCVNKRTLFDDLKALGWVLKKKKSAQAPEIKEMLDTNPVLQNIIYNKTYKAISHPVYIPAYS